MMTRRWMISLAFLLIAGAGANRLKVTIEYETRVDYSRFLTYAWARGIQVKDPRIDREIIEGIDWRLGEAGLQRVDGSGDPDLVVVYYAAEDALEVDTANLAGWGPGWESSLGHSGAAPTRLQHIDAGELAVEIAQVKGRRYIWRATVSGIIGDRPDKVRKHLSKPFPRMIPK